MAIEHDFREPDFAVALRPEDAERQHADLAAGGFDLPQQMQAAFVRAAVEQHVDRALLQRQSVVGVKIRRMAERDQRHGAGIAAGSVSVHIGSVVIEHCRIGEQMQIRRRNRRAARAELFEIDEHATKARLERFVEAVVAAENDIDRVVPQAILADADFGA